MRFDGGVQHVVEVGHAPATGRERDGVLHHQDDAMQSEARRMTDVRPAVDVFSDWAKKAVTKAWNEAMLLPWAKCSPSG